MFSKTPKLLAAALASATVAGAASAAVSSSGGDSLDASGVILYAYNFGNGGLTNVGGSASTYTHVASGIVFDNLSHTGSHSDGTDGDGDKFIDFSGYNGDGSGVLTSASSSASGFSSGVVSGADTLYYSASWTESSTDQSIKVNGLDAGKEYMIQILTGDDRNQSWAAWDFDVYVDGVDSGHNHLWGIYHGTGIEKNVLVVDELSGATSYEVSLVGGNPGISGVVVSEVPEPSSLALLGLGGLMIARRRRG